ncbi:putative Receptor protein kinase [Melia azedarach]|uniref:Receptor protein kinase n=1 Tax=Melia azedarach TaxID=155640 RepID=A0ACC1X0E3_MELAZ|nr:putative Receptor protein kinase [Melia azedarach]
MGGRWNSIGFQFLCFLVLINTLENQGCWSLNSEGLALLEFRARLFSDPFGALKNWNRNDTTPCRWPGVDCLYGKVQMLDLRELHLEGTLAPELGKLSELRILVLHRNCFSGTIPRELGELTKLELLDLRNNKLRGIIPVEISGLPSLKRLLLCNNNFEGTVPLDLKRLNLLSELQFDDQLASAVADGIGCVNRKFGQYCLWYRNLKQLNKQESFVTPIKGVLARYLSVLPLPLFNLGKDSLSTQGDNSCANLPAASSQQNLVHHTRNFVAVARRRLLEQSSNLPAAPAIYGPSSDQIIALPTARSSGTFPAVPNAKRKQYPSPTPQSSPAPSTMQRSNGTNGKSQSSKPIRQAPSDSGGSIWKYFLIIPAVAALLIVAAAAYSMCRTRAVRTIGPWKTGLSGQLQKAFVTGVPKLNGSELETACEDFSNIIGTVNGCTMYKGTLSSGVEIAVASTAINSKDWFKRSEKAYRKQIDTLSRVNHKNFVNLIGYCEEDEPFNRMMVFEYAPNGTVFEHIHVKEMEHLDWNARMRIIMGTAYCLQYMHHDLNPPVPHSNLSSHCIYLTDDYAAKVAEICFASLAVSQSKHSVDSEDNFELPPLADPETNVHSFGIVLLEIISGKVPYSEEDGPIEKWAAEYLKDSRNFSCMIDPSLKSFKQNELEVVCDVINECILPDPRHRPTMMDIVAKLREVININPDQAVPRLSPLWWAELEILSAEAT